jgi:hypothetical protein
MQLLLCTSVFSIVHQQVCSPVFCSSVVACVIVWHLIAAVLRFALVARLVMCIDNVCVCDRESQGSPHLHTQNYIGRPSLHSYDWKLVFLSALVFCFHLTRITHYHFYQTVSVWMSFTDHDRAHGGHVAIMCYALLCSALLRHSAFRRPLPASTIVTPACSLCSPASHACRHACINGVRPGHLAPAVVDAAFVEDLGLRCLRDCGPKVACRPNSEPTAAEGFRLTSDLPTTSGATLIEDLGHQLPPSRSVNEWF